MHRSFEGEAILTVGKAIEYYHDGFDGVVNVMPFTCMPSTVVSSLSLRVSADCGDMPILNLSFDGQEDPTLTTRLEAFVEQVRQRQEAAAAFAQAAAERELTAAAMTTPQIVVSRGATLLHAAEFLRGPVQLLPACNVVKIRTTLLILPAFIDRPLELIVFSLSLRVPHSTA